MKGPKRDSSGKNRAFGYSRNASNCCFLLLLISDAVAIPYVYQKFIHSFISSRALCLAVGKILTEWSHQTCVSEGKLGVISWEDTLGAPSFSPATSKADPGP